MKREVVDYPLIRTNENVRGGEFKIAYWNAMSSNYVKIFLSKSIKTHMK